MNADAVELVATPRPPNRAMSTPAARIPRKRKRLTATAVNIPIAIADPNWKKAKISTADACD